MNGFMKSVLTLALLCLIAVPVQAGTDLSFSGQIRNQSFMERRAFNPDAEFMNYDLLRTRFNVKGVIDDNTTVFVQLQDSRTYGVGGYSGTTTGGMNVDLHQGYIAIKNLFGEGWGGMTGRFEFVRGNHRIFGNVGWSNVGRSWDGGTLWYMNDKLNITAFGLKKVERDPIGNTLNRNDDEDTDVLGVYSELNDYNVDLFAVLEQDARDVYVKQSATATDSSVEKAMDRVTVGTYYHRDYQQFDFVMNAALQFGKYVAFDPTTKKGPQYDYGGILFAFEAGYSLQDTRNTRVAAGIDYTSGDKDATDQKDKAFYNLYWTGHKFNGYMDYFTDGGPNGLMDLMLRARTDLTRGWTLALDAHMFSAAQDYSWSYVDANSNSVTRLSKDVGTEFDLTVNTNRVAGVGIQAGISYFIAKDQFAKMMENDPGIWSYGMVTANF